MTAPDGAPAIRLSDLERQQAIALLDGAAEDGRLTWLEHGERVGGVLASRTRDELTPLLADLGAAAPAVAARATEAEHRVVALGSKIVRNPGRARRVRAKATFGAVVLTLDELAPGEEVRVEASSFCGKVVLHVPEDTVVIDEGDALFGKRKVFGSGGADGAPVVRITGRSTLGHLRVVAGRRRFW